MARKSKVETHFCEVYCLSLKYIIFCSQSHSHTDTESEILSFHSTANHSTILGVTVVYLVIVFLNDLGVLLVKLKQRYPLVTLRLNS